MESQQSTKRIASVILATLSTVWLVLWVANMAVAGLAIYLLGIVVFGGLAAVGVTFAVRPGSAPSVCKGFGLIDEVLH